MKTNWKKERINTEEILIVGTANENILEIYYYDVFIGNVIWNSLTQTWRPQGSSEYGFTLPLAAGCKMIEPLINVEILNRDLQ